MHARHSLAMIALLAIVLAAPPEATAAPPGLDQAVTDTIAAPAVDQVLEVELVEFGITDQVLEIEQLVEVRTIELETIETAPPDYVAEVPFDPTDYIDDDAARLRAMTIDVARMQSGAALSATPSGPLLCLRDQVDDRHGITSRRKGDRAAGITE